MKITSFAPPTAMQLTPPEQYTPKITQAEMQRLEERHIEIHNLQKIHHLALLLESYSYNRMGKGNPPVHREGQVVDISI
jgi:hypothetical protein